MIMIITPYVNNIERHCTESARAILAAFPGSQWMRAQNGLGQLANVRNKLIDQVPDGFDAVMWLDSDTGVDVRDVREAVESGLDVVGIAYPHEQRGGLVGGDWYGEPGVARSELLEYTGREIRRCDWVGSGATMIRRAVFDRLERPYYRYEWVMGGTGQSSEGMGFCVNCERCGVPIHILMTDRCVHKKLAGGGAKMQDLGVLQGILEAEMQGGKRVSAMVLKLAEALNAAEAKIADLEKRLASEQPA
jgi:hypothetical protein